MRLILAPAAAAAVLALSTVSQTRAAAPSSAKPAEPAWVTRSNSFAKPLLDIGIKYIPESGSAEGLSQHDTEIDNPSLAQELPWGRSSAPSASTTFFYPRACYHQAS